MFLGHYAVGLAAKKWTPKVSLGTLFFATAWLDILWSLFLVLGLESVSITPGITKVVPIDFMEYTLSHSLVMAVTWAVVFGLISLMITKYEKTSLIIAGVVVSHWFLNVITHRPDMSLLCDGAPLNVRWGLGLWNSVAGTIIVEGLLFVGGLYLYLKSTKATDDMGQWAIWVLAAVIVLAFSYIFWMPLPTKALLVANEGLVQLLFVAGGYWVDDHRKAA